MKKNFASLMIPVLAAAVFMSSAAQEKPAPARSSSEIFNEIMQSLPNDARAKIDSIHTLVQNRKIGQPSCSLSLGRPAADAGGSAALGNLSPDLRQKVEKAIQEIEKQRQKRQLQFKESHSQ